MTGTVISTYSSSEDCRLTLLFTRAGPGPASLTGRFSMGSVIGCGNNRRLGIYLCRGMTGSLPLRAFRVKEGNHLYIFIIHQQQVLNTGIVQNRLLTLLPGNLVQCLRNGLVQPFVGGFYLPGGYFGNFPQYAAQRLIFYIQGNRGLSSDLIRSPAGSCRKISRQQCPHKTLPNPFLLLRLTV